MMGASVTPWPGSTMMDRVTLDDIPHKGKFLDDSPNATHTDCETDGIRFTKHFSLTISIEVSAREISLHNSQWFFAFFFAKRKKKLRAFSIIDFYH